MTLSKKQQLIMELDNALIDAREELAGIYQTPLAGPWHALELYRKSSMIEFGVSDKWAALMGVEGVTVEEMQHYDHRLGMEIYRPNREFHDKCTAVVLRFTEDA